jgi:hypothetical protein
MYFFLDFKLHVNFHLLSLFQELFNHLKLTVAVCPACSKDR